MKNESKAIIIEMVTGLSDGNREPIYTYVSKWLYEELKRTGADMKHVRQFKSIPPYK